MQRYFSSTSERKRFRVRHRPRWPCTLPVERAVAFWSAEPAPRRSFRYSRVRRMHTTLHFTHSPFHGNRLQNLTQSCKTGERRIRSRRRAVYETFGQRILRDDTFRGKGTDKYNISRCKTYTNRKQHYRSEKIIRSVGG